MKTSPNKHPVLTKRRAQSADFDVRCPDKGDDCGKRPPKSKSGPLAPVTPITASKKSRPSLITHTKDDCLDRVEALIAKNEATPGFFAEVVTDLSLVQDKDERWFMQVKKSKIENGFLRAVWCKTNSLTLVAGGKECPVHVHSIKDYGDQSNFI